MNKETIKQRFQKAIGSYHHEAVAQRQIAETLFRLLNRHHPKTNGFLLEIGCGTGFLTERLLAGLSPEKAWLNDICPEVEPAIAPYLSPADVFLPGDAETIAFPALKFDLIASASAIQWLDNPALFLSKLSQQLQPDGLLAISTFGPDNMKEIRQITGSGLDYPDIRTMVSGRFEIAEFYQESVTLRFPSPKAVLQHLKQTGVTGNSRQKWTPGNLRDFEQRYRAAYGDETGVSLTYQPIYIVATVKNK